MKRRHFITLLSGAAAWPLAARAQQPERIKRLGVLLPGTEGAYGDPFAIPDLPAFTRALVELGWTEGRNIQIVYRYAAYDPARIKSNALELLSLVPDVILANTTPVLEAVRVLTRSVPIVFMSVSDPVSAGFVPSLARPGGNITGFSNFEYEIGGKWLNLLKQAVPDTTRVGVLLWQGDPSWSRYLAPIEAVAPSLGIQLTRIFLADSAETERAIDAFAPESHGGLLVTNSGWAVSQRDTIIARAARHRLPAIYPQRRYVVSGGLISYGSVRDDITRLAATYVDRILRGEKPGDLPVQTPTKYDLVINLRTPKCSASPWRLPC
jgi:putative ABC transport system substrate-binding protein